MQRIHWISCSGNTSGHPILLRFTSLLVPETPMKKMINLHYSFIVYIVVGSRNNKKNGCALFPYLLWFTKETTDSELMCFVRPGGGPLFLNRARRLPNSFLLSNMSGSNLWRAQIHASSYCMGWNRGLEGGLAEMMLQSRLNWFWKLVGWGGLGCEIYIIKLVWFSFGPVHRTTSRLTGDLLDFNW